MRETPQGCWSFIRPLSTICIFVIEWYQVCHPQAMKQLICELLSAQHLRKGEKLVFRWNHLKERQIPKRIYSFINIA